MRYKNAFNQSKQTTIRRNNKGDKITTLREAKKIERDFLTEAENKFSTNITYDELFNLNIQKPNLTLRTRTNKQRDYRIHIEPFFGHIRVKDIQPYQVIEFQKYLLDKLSPNSARSVYSTFKSIINHGMKYHGILNDPCRAVDAIRRVKPNVNYIMLPDLKILVSSYIAVNEITVLYYQILTELLFFTGLRIGEALPLTWNKLNIENEEILINCGLDVNNNIINEWTKTESGYRYVTPPSTLFEKLLTLKKWQEENVYGWNSEMYIFGGISHIKYSTYQAAFFRALKRSDIKKIRIHDLRHSFAAFNVSCNVDIYTLRDLMGHGDIKVTINTYGHLYPQKRIEAKEKHAKAIEKLGYSF